MWPRLVSPGPALMREAWTLGDLFWNDHGQNNVHIHVYDVIGDVERKKGRKRERKTPEANGYVYVQKLLKM